jgi:hypothetical protein
MAARLGQQRGVIAFRLIGVGAREVDELGTAHFEQPRARQILTGGDHLVRRLGVRQIAGLVDEDDPAGHGRVPSGSRPRCEVRPIMQVMSGAARGENRLGHYSPGSM